MSRGGYWNRAGRRSGEYRPTLIYVKPASTVRYKCPECGNDELPDLVTSGCSMCRLIVANHDQGRFTKREVER
jgi:hypothetical protein